MVYNVYGTNNPDTLTGNDDVNNIYGYGGNDTLLGFGGNDALIGGPGADAMIGGPGNDYYLVDNTGDVVIEKVGEGHDSIQSEVSWVATPTSEIESIVAGGDGTRPLNFTGNIHSDSYSLSISGNGLINKLDDGGGRADLFGGYGNDAYTVNNEHTVVWEFDGFIDYNPGHGPDVPGPPAPAPLLEGYDTVRTSLANYALPNNVEALSYFGTVNFTGIGNAENNNISGGSGDDVLDGGAGADRLAGGAGNDTYYFDNIGDYATEQAGGGNDTIYTSINAKASFNVESLIYTGTTGAALYAADSGTSIVGGNGNDKLWGGAGSDTLDGEYQSYVITTAPDGTTNYTQGVDILFGGAGSDTFVFHPVSGSAIDRIVDFAPGVDHLEIDDPGFFNFNFVFTTDAPQPPDPTGGGHNIVQIMYYDQQHGSLYYIDGTDFSTTQHLVATFGNHPMLHESDFILA
ncbi:MAG: calcium-binding protein [Bradyrhizobiaceae bacterium]|jgi:Ca2+-binding RTX toxin-like protein|nr:MAG: calcium-binding protein [Bradyrhizobiaceae bacterium]